MKRTLIVASTVLLGTSVFAYNPPAGGQNLLKITSPELLTGANSSAGGALETITPDSILNNPALPGFNQRNALGASGSLIFDSNDKENSIGGGFDLGISFATSVCVPTIVLQGVFSPYPDMHLGNNISLTGGYAKEITDNLSVGLNLNGGLIFGDDFGGTDWTLSAALGAYYKAGDVSFLKNLRFGVALSNLGKMYSKTSVLGIEDYEDYKKYPENVNTAYLKALDIDNGAWPALATFKVGAAASLLDTNNFDVGLSLDLVTPGFQNFVFDAGVQILILDLIKISTAWEFDVREFTNDAKNILPAVGFSAKFKINTKNQKLQSKGWAENEIATNVAWHRVYENVDIVTFGADLDLGKEDKDAPEITLW